MRQYSIDQSSEPVGQFVRNQVREGSPLELLDGGEVVAVLVPAKNYKRHYTPKKDFRQSLLKIRQKYGLDDPNFDDTEMSDDEFDEFWDNLRYQSAVISQTNESAQRTTSSKGFGKAVMDWRKKYDVDNWDDDLDIDEIFNVRE